MILDERIEDMLKILWESVEESGRPMPPEMVPVLVQEGLAVVTEGECCLTSAGRHAARQVIRRHRLAERLVLDVLEIAAGDMEGAACHMEHGLRRGVEERVCGLLGHPKSCPHGKPIPPGPCCMDGNTEGSDVCSISKFRRGQEGVVAYLKTHDSKQVQKLMAMGVRPGVSIRVDRTVPSFLFTIGYSQFAVDADLADLIQVRLSVDR